MAAWQTFADISGSAAAALAGLLFVSVSIRIDVIAPSRALRNRAAQTLVLFVSVLLVALCLAIPEQSRQALGGELLALAALAGAIVIFLGRQAQKDGAADTPRLAVALDATTPNAITLILLAVAALLLIAGLHAGLYVLVAPVVVALGGGVISVWLLLTRLSTRPESQSSPR
jgi:hypothetical protein